MLDAPQRSPLGNYYKGLDARGVLVATTIGLKSGEILSHVGSATKVGSSCWFNAGADPFTTTTIWWQLSIYVGSNYGSPQAAPPDRQSVFTGTWSKITSPFTTFRLADTMPNLVCEATNGANGYMYRSQQSSGGFMAQDQFGNPSEFWPDYWARVGIEDPGGNDEVWRITMYGNEDDGVGGTVFPPGYDTSIPTGDGYTLTMAA